MDHDYEDAYEHRARMLQKLEMVWHSNPHLTFMQLVGYVTQGGSLPIDHRTKKPWVQQQNDACERRIDEALKASGDEDRDIYHRYRPGKAPLAQPAPHVDLNAQVPGFGIDWAAFQADVARIAVGRPVQAPNDFARRGGMERGLDGQ